MPLFPGLSIDFGYDAGIDIKHTTTYMFAEGCYYGEILTDVFLQQVAVFLENEGHTDAAKEIAKVVATRN